MSKNTVQQQQQYIPFATGPDANQTTDSALRYTKDVRNPLLNNIKFKKSRNKCSSLSGRRTIY